VLGVGGVVAGGGRRWGKVEAASPIYLFYHTLWTILIPGLDSYNHKNHYRNVLPPNQITQSYRFPGRHVFHRHLGGSARM